MSVTRLVAAIAELLLLGLRLIGPGASIRARA